MSTYDQQQKIDFFHEVLDQPPDRRDAFIAQRHASDPEMIDHLRRLLAGHVRAQQSTNDVGLLADTQGAQALEPMPQWIGPYRVLERIGEGGMGVVYSAEQTEPIRRRVAVKVIKLGMDTKEVIARFEAERQALAMLDHPGVARVFDAGSTDTGRPYFVMELVKGLPLTEYCAKQRLLLRDRLRLFVEMCKAIQHAHQRGIIHRDLKPSNVLVAVPEGQPIPKVIDFGVAKATALRLSERTVFTEQGKLIGTPEYMSPEQADMSGLDVDTRSDVYSLGVLLYELLTGVLPFDSKQLRSGGYGEIQRIIRDVDPPRPSTRLSDLSRSEEPSGAFPGASARHLRGELDWIVMRAMEKDRTRRYESASALFRDVERYLADEPVQAGPPSAAYKARKFIKRHRYVTFAAASALLAAAVGVTGLMVGLIDARRAQALADRRADNALAAANFLQRVLFHIDPEYGAGRLSLQEVFDIASRSVERELGDYPEVEASVHESIGVNYRRLSMFQQAEPHLRRSLEIRRELLGDLHPQTARSFVAMAYLRFEHQGHIDEALDDLEYATRSYTANGMTDTSLHAWLLLDIGLINLAGDRLAPAEKAFEWSKNLMSEYRGADNADVSRPLRGLAMVALRRNELAEAERLARDAVRLCEGEGTFYIGARAKLVLAIVLEETNELDEVARLLSESRTQFAQTVDARHLRMTELDAALARLHLLRNEFSQAGEVAARCLSVRRELLSPEHWALLEARLLQQRARIGLQQADVAEPELLKISESAEDVLGNDHPLTINIAKARVDCAVALGDQSLETTRKERLTLMKERRQKRLADGVP